MSLTLLDKEEKKRLTNLKIFEKKARQEGFKKIAGVDEAGRGPLAGPVVAAACIIKSTVLLPGVDDSKKLTPQKRAELFQLIKSHKGITYGIGIVCHQEIDKINIYQATLQAMLRAILNLQEQPDYILVDGMNLPHPTIPCEKIIQGDMKSQSIAAASIIAKETRDQLMVEYDQNWPEYGFKKHKGYGTQMHLEMIAKYGISPIHRLSFEPVKSSIK